MDDHAPPPPKSRHPLQPRYDAIWNDAAGALRAGDVDLDLRLAAGGDPRRGLTVIARPDAATAAHFTWLLDRLEALEPGQYRHPPADMHVTVLSLFTVRAAVNGMAGFEIAFRGVTASRGAVLAQGYPADATLETLRERLRIELRARALDGALDRRYRLVTAHSTLMRFVRPLARPAHFADALAALRTAPLGTTRVERVALVQNDWTMRSEVLRTIETFGLA